MFVSKTRARWLVALACGVILPLGRAEGPADWPIGLWRVEEKAGGLTTRLASLEVRTTRAKSDAVVVAYQEDGRGSPRVWGSSRLTWSGDGASAAWEGGGSRVSLVVRLRKDGKLDAVVRERSGDRANGGDRVRQVALTREVGEDRLVTAAEARKLPAARPSPGGNAVSDAGVFTIDADGGDLRLVAPPDGFRRAAHPAWSRDGRRLAFTAFDATGRDPLIRLVEARGGPTTAVAAGVAPSWSRDGGRLAYMASGKGELVTDWNAPGRNDERIEALCLTGDHAGEVEVIGQGLWPRWSPTDDRLAFAARRDGNWEIYVRSADGLRVRRLTDGPSMDTRPVWSADGSSLIFLSDRGNRWDLYRVDAEGRGEPTRVTNHPRREEGADLSPDGRRIAFFDAQGENAATLILMETASGLSRPLIEPSVVDRDPAWSPDGRTIAFTSRRR